jgi:hypothetical protein
MLTKEQRKNRPLPTLAELEEVEALGNRFYDKLESAAFRVKSMDEAWNEESIAPELLPTHEQIGYLYLFAHYMDMRADEIRREANEILVALSGLGIIQTDVPLRRAAKEVGDDA